MRSQLLVEWASAALWLGVSAVALRLGRAPVRAVAASVVLSVLLVLGLQRFEDVYRMQWTMLTGDVLVLAACVWAQARSRSVWPSCAGGFQALSITTHVVKVLDPTILSWGYLTLAAVWGYGMLACLVWGALLDRGR